jgi:hypothetical protein
VPLPDAVRKPLPAYYSSAGIDPVQLSFSGANASQVKLEFSGGRVKKTFFEPQSLQDITNSPNPTKKAVFGDPFPNATERSFYGDKRSNLLGNPTKAPLTPRKIIPKDPECLHTRTFWEPSQELLAQLSEDVKVLAKKVFLGAQEEDVPDINRVKTRFRSRHTASMVSKFLDDQSDEIGADRNISTAEGIYIL